MALKAQRTQDFVPIKEIHDGIIVLKDGGLRAVLVVSSINLSLKSSEEQKATILEFQSFLNSLDFSTQIVVQSRRLDIRPYLISLEERMKVQTEPLIKIQTKEYMAFIKSFTEEVSIMKKSFFVVVPYSSSGVASKTSFIEKIIGSKKERASTKIKDLTNFEEKRSQLDQRVSVIADGLNRFGVRSSQLGTEEIVELFYKTFNPGDISQGIKLE